MVTSAQCLKKYGDPNLIETQNKHFTIWEVDNDIRQSFAHVRFSAVGTIGFPKKIFLNKDFQPILERALRNVIDRGLASEMKTWDGCYVIRQKRGLTSMSLHSWGLAVDINASQNQLGKTRAELIALGKKPLSEAFIKCFRDAGCDCGADWTNRPDLMHMQIGKI